MKKITKESQRAPQSREQVIEKTIHLDNYYFDTAKALKKRIEDINKSTLFTENLLVEVESLEREIKMLRDSLSKTYISLLKQGYYFP